MTTDTQGVVAVSTPGREMDWRRTAVAFLITLIGLFVFVAAFAAGYAAVHTGRVLPGVSAGGVALAGLDRAGAEAALRRDLPNLGSGRLTLAIGDTQQVISYSEIGRDYDMPRILDAAFGVGRAGGPLDQAGSQVRTMLNGVSVPLAVTWDTGKLAQRVAAIAAQETKSAVDATIERPDGRYAVIEAQDGQHIDAQAALAQATAVLATVSDADTTVEVKPQIVEPAISTAKVQAVVDRANAVAASPLTVSIGTKTQRIDAATIDGWIHLDATAPGEWQLTIERGPVEQWVDTLKTQVDVPAKNAGYTFEEAHPVVTPAAEGSAIDRGGAINAVLAALNGRAGGTPGEAVQLSAKPVAPEFSTDQARVLVGRVRRLGAWTTHYTASAHNGFGQNIRRPTALINGTVVQPGEQFDFVAVAGPINQANGYTDGAAIIHGNTQLDGVLGGGLCSSSTTLFNAALRAGFQIDARRNHAYYIDRYPVGLDATIWVNGNYAQTMAFTNDSQFPILIKGANHRDSVTFSIYGVPDGRHVELSDAKVWAEKKAWTQYIYSKDTELVAPGGRKRVEYPFTGFSASVDRVVTTADGTILHQETFRSSYRRVIGQILLGWEPGDPPPGTVLEPGKPADA